MPAWRVQHRMKDSRGAQASVCWRVGELLQVTLLPPPPPEPSPLGRLTLTTLPNKGRGAQKSQPEDLSQHFFQHLLSSHPGQAVAG